MEENSLELLKYEVVSKCSQLSKDDNRNDSDYKIM